MTDDELERQLRSLFQAGHDDDVEAVSSLRSRLRRSIGSDASAAGSPGRRRWVAVVLAAALAGAVIVGGSTLIGTDRPRSLSVPPPASASPTPSRTSPSASPATLATPALPTASPRPTEDVSRADVLPDGTLVISRPFPIALTMTLPERWHVTDDTAGLIQLSTSRGGPGQGFRTTMFFTMVHSLYRDPCQAGTQAPDDSPDALARALADLPRLRTSGPVERVLDGYRALVVELTAPARLESCPNGAWRLWPGANEHWLVPGERNEIWIVDVEAVRLVISIEHFKDDPDESAAEVDQMIDSIRIIGLTE